MSTEVDSVCSGTLNGCLNGSATLCPLYVGDDLLIDMCFFNDDGSELDLTGHSVTLTIKEKVTDSIAAYSVTQTDLEMLNPVEGLVNFLVDDSVTQDWSVRSYVYDLVLDSPEGIKATLVSGSLPVIRGVS